MRTDPAGAAVLVHQPQGAWPTEFPGYYGPDEEHIKKYLQSSMDSAIFDDYLDNEVLKSN